MNGSISIKTDIHTYCRSHSNSSVPDDIQIPIDQSFPLPLHSSYSTSTNKDDHDDHDRHRYNIMNNTNRAPLSLSLSSYLPSLRLRLRWSFSSLRRIWLYLYTWCCGTANDNNNKNYNKSDDLFYDDHYNDYKTNIGIIDDRIPPLYDVNDTPEFLRTAYILRGYRAFLSFRQCTRSLYRPLHNESMNIWTHLLATIYILYLAYEAYNILITYDDNQHHHQTTIIDYLLFGIYYTTAISCFLCSTLYHWYGCMSVRAHSCLYIGDMSAIGLLILGSCPLIHISHIIVYIIHGIPMYIIYI